MWTDEELKEKIKASLEVYEFLDATQITFEDLIELLWDQLSEEQKDAASRAAE